VSCPVLQRISSISNVRAASPSTRRHVTLAASIDWLERCAPRVSPPSPFFRALLFFSGLFCRALLLFTESSCRVLLLFTGPFCRVYYLFLPEPFYIVRYYVCFTGLSAPRRSPVLPPPAHTLKYKIVHRDATLRAINVGEDGRCCCCNLMLLLLLLTSVRLCTADVTYAELRSFDYYSR
jgi:hypothetical protein